ncbi:MAG: 3'(2'),5'-bisphosphate nucleotidase CysQ [Tidjanibacter sp.]|nr:3'(2'),5'-bisphosphate nucleotidase CysQ [Tidjanibacter sp.]
MITAKQKQVFLPKAVNAAIRAGRAILDIYESPEHALFDLKKDKTPITTADRRAHEIIKQYLGFIRIPILSEEGRELLYEERKAWDLFWLVDPLDGTVEFLKGNGEFTVNIALMVDNHPTIGVIYVPYKGELYFNDPDKGAYKRENVTATADVEWTYDDLFEGSVSLPSVAPSEQKPLRVAISRSHNTPETFAHIDTLRTKYPDLEVVEQGSSYKFCLIAEGSVDYYVRTTKTYEWDTAAGEAILTAAGGQTLSYPEGEPLKYNDEWIENPHFTCRGRRCVL